ncbi:hypothetical protein PCE1_004699 [Barthelona sp. PCE]
MLPATEISESEIFSVFSFLDINKDNSIDSNELYKLAKRLRYENINLDELDRAVRDVSINSTTIAFPQFLALLSKTPAPEFSASDLYLSFENLKDDEIEAPDGYIKKDNLQRMLETYSNVSSEEFEELLLHLNIDKENDFLPFEALISMLR